MTRGLRSRFAGMIAGLRPDGMALRFALLLTAALVVAMLVAAALLLADRARNDDAALIERELERIVSLVPAIEAAAPDARMRVARAASTRVSRVSVDAAPAVAGPGDGPRSAVLTRALERALPGRAVRAAILVRGDRDDDDDDDDDDHHRGDDARVRVALSIALPDAAGGPQWLNVVSRGGRVPPHAALPGRPFLVVLGVSLVAVLGVALVFVRRLTGPLRALAQAAQAAGQGDRGARAPETGPRELRAAAAAFNAMQARIAAFEAERMRTLAAVGHDLRTPITSLRIRAEMLDEDAAAPMIRTLDEMTVMADGLVAWARGAAEAEPTRAVDLAALLGRLCAERGLDWAGGAALSVQGRPVALGRAVGNVLDNAKRYAGSARVTLRRAGDMAEITVEDDGPGIPPDRLGAVFDPFVRGDDSRSAETGGAGLGLSIARGILAAHGGSIVLANRGGGGLRATLRLPL